MLCFGRLRVEQFVKPVAEGDVGRLPRRRRRVKRNTVHVPQFAPLAATR